MAADPPFHPDTALLNQHFLQPTTARTLVDRTDIGRTDVVLDLGAGTGAITAEILRHRPRRTIAIEADRRCLPSLTRLATSAVDLDVRISRIQDLDPADLTEVTMIIANPPFSALEHIAALLRTVVSLRSADLCVSLTWARSVVASPGSDRYSLSSLVLQSRFDAAIVELVPGSSFTPAIRRPAAWLHLQPAPRTDPLLDLLADAALHRAGLRIKDLLRSPQLARRSIPSSRVAGLRRDPHVADLQQRRLSALTRTQLGQLVRAIEASR